jgi:hypothetical protein
MAAIKWLKNNINTNERIIALSGMPIEIVFNWLPKIPISACINYQIFRGDTERIISILEVNKNAKYVLLHIDDSGYNFGVQDYKLADYLDEKWQQIFRVGIPDTLTKLTMMSPERKRDSGLRSGIVILKKVD